MKILCVETGTNRLSISLFYDNEIKTVFGELDLHHLVELTPLIEATLKKNNLTLRNLDYLAVSEGPGSYTGLRIGVGTIRAISQALDKKIISVPTLESYKHIDVAETKVKVPIIDARAGGVYAAAIKGHDILIPTNVFTPQELKAKLHDLHEDIVFYKEDAKKFFDESSLEQSVEFRATEHHSEHILLVALLMLDGGYDPISYNDLLPQYYRMTEAERRLNE